MEDWQRCLSPLCQTALQHARDSVAQRGGHAITVEDFLLALLDGSPDITGFLCERGVDMDELIRTIQCEQPIVTEVGSEGLLSSQLQYWFATAREISDTPWLDWPLLLKVLTHSAERLQGKAYVAVMEMVGDWPLSGMDSQAQSRLVSASETPIVITDPTWLALAEDVAVTLASVPQALVWVRGPRGAGKSSWLKTLVSSITTGFVALDLRRGKEVMASDHPAFPSAEADGVETPVLILDNTSPADALAMLNQPAHIASELLPGHRGPILLLGPEAPEVPDAGVRLGHLMGRSLDTFDMPPSSAGQNLAILTAHQSAIEKRWNVALPQQAIRFASSSQSWVAQSPGALIQWVERAAARLNLFAERGPLEGQALSGQMDTLRRQTLVALARREPMDELEQSLEALAVERAATEIAWYERRANGTLRTLMVEDLRYELERWLAAGHGPVHYVVHCDRGMGETTGAGSGNLHS